MGRPVLVEMWHPTPPGERVPRYVQVLRGCVAVAALALLGGFFYVAFQLTLTPVRDHGQAGANFTPGDSLRFYLNRPTKEALYQIGGNLALLAPMGVLLPLIAKRLRGPLRLAVLTGLFSLAIELVQGAFVLGRAFDIDDVILNLTGVVLAYLILGRRLSKGLRGD